MKTQTASINGMHCSSCEKVVSKRIFQIPGVQNVQVDVENGNTIITSENGVSEEKVKEMLQDTHYSVTNINKYETTY